ncbi:MAG: amidohydrolase family protein [Cetobacterium sp.]
MSKNIFIKNGRVINPETGLDAVKNILIENGIIKSIDDEIHSAETIIDAENYVVSPGFIDIHMHEDIEGEDTIGKTMLKMGVTSSIGGNCGVARINPENFKEVLDRGYPINLGLMLGHSYLREQIQKVDKYSPSTRDEIDQMFKNAERLLASGFFGISYGIRYIPGMTKEELLEISKACVKDDKIISAHVRDDAKNIFSATVEIVEIAKELNIGLQNSHVGSMAGYGQMKELLDYIDDEVSKGANIMSDCYPYNAFCTGIKESTFDDGFLERYNIDYSSLEISAGKYKGRRCTEEIFNELRNGDENILVIGHVMNPDDIEIALMHKNVIIASDGILEDGEGHPRASGTFPRFIKNYIKTSKLSLLEGIRKISTLPAQKLKLKNKGKIMVGADADITIFSLEEIEDRATFKSPTEEPIGIKYVIVNGEVAYKNGEVVNSKLGKALISN